MGLNYYASSPTLVLPPQHLAQPLMHHPGEIAMTDNRAVLPAPSARKFVPKIPTPPSLNYLAQAFNGAAGRKRSRADIGEDMEDESQSALIEPIHSHDGGPSNDGMSVRPTSSDQSESYGLSDGVGLGPEDQSAVQHKTTITDRPRLTARKSQRRIVDDQETTSNAYTESDLIVRKLGIGWKLVRDPQSPAIAGQQAFIRNQFSFEDPQILLQHEGLGILVVRSTPASAQGYWDQWWLFTDDLKSCRFLCRDETELFRRLNNKRQDDRGIWQPEIIVEGPVIRARDAAIVVDEVNGQQGFSSDVAHCHSVQTTQVDKDVQMLM